MKKVILILLGLGTFLNAQPYNSNVLIQRGIDPKILNNTVTTARQNVAYKMAVEHSKEIGDEKATANYFIIFDPYASYGVDMRIQIPKDEVSKLNKGDIRQGLDELMAIQLHLQNGTFYDEDTLEVHEKDAQTTLITFGYNVDEMPPEMDYFEYLRGTAYIINGNLEKIVLKNIKRFEMKDIEVDSLEKVVHFTKVALNGGYLVSKESVEIHGVKNSKPYHEKIFGHIEDYWDDTKQTIPYKGGFSKRLPTKDDEKYETIFVELDRTFPLLGKAARKEGFDLPKPFGISMVTMMQETTLHMDSFKIDGKDVSWLIGGKDPTYTSRAMAGLTRVDMWILPFLNVGVILGGVSSETTVEDLNLGSSLPLDSFIPLIETTSILYGAGATVAGGVGDFFATVDMQYITAYTEAADVELSMMILTPIVGYSFERYNTRLLLGGQYQDMKESLTANVDGKIIEVGLSSEKWAGLLGVEKGFTRHWNGSIMYSQGEDRKSFNMMMGYRF